MRTTNRRGGSAIEFALTLPVFLMLIGGIFDWSWYAYQRSILKTSVTQGCRTASLVDPGVGDRSMGSVYAVGTRAIEENLERLGGTHLCEGEDGCKIEIDVIGFPPGRMVQCSVSGTFSPLWGLDITEQPVHAADVDRLAWQRWPDA